MIGSDQASAGGPVNQRAFGRFSPTSAAFSHFLAVMKILRNACCMLDVYSPPSRYRQAGTKHNDGPGDTRLAAGDCHRRCHLGPVTSSTSHWHSTASRISPGGMPRGAASTMPFQVSSLDPKDRTGPRAVNRVGPRPLTRPARRYMHYAYIKTGDDDVPPPILVAFHSAGRSVPPVIRPAKRTRPRSAETLTASDGLSYAPPSNTFGTYIWRGTASRV